MFALFHGLTPHLCARAASEAAAVAMPASCLPAAIQRTNTNGDRSGGGGSQRSELKIKAAAMITEEAADAVRPRGVAFPLSFSSFLSAVRTTPQGKAAALSASLVRGS